MTLEEIKKLKYMGAGYFRLSEKDGRAFQKREKAPIIHAPELKEILIRMVESERTNSNE